MLRQQRCLNDVVVGNLGPPFLYWVSQCTRCFRTGSASLLVHIPNGQFLATGLISLIPLYLGMTQASPVVSNIAFSPEGRSLISASQWTVLFNRKFWQVTLEMGFAHAYQHQWVGRGIAGSGTVVGWKVLEFALQLMATSRSRRCSTYQRCKHLPTSVANIFDPDS